MTQQRLNNTELNINDIDPAIIKVVDFLVRKKMKEYLKENLTIDINVIYAYGEIDSVELVLKIEGETIADGIYI